MKKANKAYIIYYLSYFSIFIKYLFLASINARAVFYIAYPIVV